MFNIVATIIIIVFAKIGAIYSMGLKSTFRLYGYLVRCKTLKLKVGEPIDDSPTLNIVLYDMREISNFLPLLRALRRVFR